VSVINLADRRQPVSYTVRITQHWDGRGDMIMHPALYCAARNISWRLKSAIRLTQMSLRMVCAQHSLTGASEVEMTKPNPNHHTIHFESVQEMRDFRNHLTSIMDAMDDAVIRANVSRWLPKKK